jgi:hypothetical protein
MFYPRLFPVFRRITRLVLLGCFLFSAKCILAQTPAQAPPPDTTAKTDSAAKPAQTPPSNDKLEVSSHDAPTTFKVRVNLVLVRVVVRDAQGKVVGNLKREDFQLFDSRKAQTI